MAKFGYAKEKWYFIDGTYLDIAFGALKLSNDAGDIAINLQYPENITFSGNNVEYPQNGLHCVIACFDSSGNKVAGFTGQKTDVVGNVWTVSNTGITIVTSTGVQRTLSYGNAPAGYYRAICAHWTFVSNNGEMKRSQMVLSNCRVPTYSTFNYAGTSYNDACYVNHYELPNNDSLVPEKTFIETKFDSTARDTYVGFHVESNYSGNDFPECICKIKVGNNAWCDYTQGMTGQSAISFTPEEFGTKGEPSDPYIAYPPSDAGGGLGSGDFNGDTIPEPSLPSKSAMGTGLVQLYNPTVSQLSSFGQWLWNANGFDLNDLKRIFNDPMDMIIGLSIFPVTPATSDTPSTIKLGNLDSEVESKVLSSQFKRIDLGTIDLKEVYNSYLDYAPYTKVQIFLPFIGIRDLDCDDVMGKAIHLTYSIDMLSGACVAHIIVNGSTMYEYGGSCNEQVPLTARDLTTIFSGIASVVATGAGAVAAISAGIAALPAEATAGAVLGTAGVGVVGAGASIARNVISSKPSVEHASGIGGTTGYLSCKKPFLLVQRPRLCHPKNQEHFTGYPGFIYVSALSQLEGFTKMVNVELTRIHATDAELEEIAEWLMSKGVRI